MPLPDSNLSTLSQIRTKVRRLTRSLSPSQLADSTIDDYVNTFVLYDFPEHLRLFNLRTTLSWYCEPYISTYDPMDPALGVDSPLYNFSNKYLNVFTPIYIAGYEAFYSQSREQFFSIYPKIESIIQIGVGNGVTTTFTGTLPGMFPVPVVPPVPAQRTPILQRSVLFSSVDINNVGCTIIDDPLAPDFGQLIVPNDTTVPHGTIDYITGAYSLTFVIAPLAGAKVNAQVVYYQPAIPSAMLFFDGKFELRPVPDQPYKIEMEVAARPTELLLSGDVPKLSEWWQYIAYGAAKKVFEDRMDMDSVQMIMPEFKQQERLILRRTLVQNTDVRTATIYTDSNNGATGFGWGSGGLV